MDETTSNTTSSQKDITKIESKFDSSSVQIPTKIPFSQNVDRAIQQVLPSNDIFDSPFFDPIEYLNEKFPNEQAINDNLEAFASRVRRQIRVVDDEILNTVRRQSSAGVHSKKDLEDAKNMIHNLYMKIQDIKQKAAQSEQMVQNITKDIKSLDTGKKNLTSTITALQRLHMLVSAVDQLKVMSKKKQYKKAAEKLHVANQLMEFFAPFNQIPKIKKLYEEVNAVKLELQGQIFKDFKSLDAHEGVANLPQLLADACQVVDALGMKVRNQLIQQFTKQQIQLYKMIYSGKNAQKNKAKDLDSDIKKRVGWITKTLENYEKMYSQVFPDHWCVRQELIIEFCLATRDDISQILLANRDSLDGRIVYRSVNSVIKFEGRMHDRFHVKTEIEKQTELKRQQEQLSKEVEELQDVNSLEARKQRMRMILRQRELERQAQDMQEDLSEADKGKKLQKNYNFKGFISSVFEDYIDVYIGFEDKSMNEALITVCTQETWNDIGGKNRNAQELFMYIQSSIEKCLSLSKGKVLVKMLEQVWKKNLRKYADFLTNNLPKITQLSNAPPPPPPKEDMMNSVMKFNLSSLITGESSSTKVTQPKPVRFTQEDEEKVCYIVNLAIYCQENIEVLQDMLKMAADELFVNQIDLGDEMNKFYVVFKSAVEQLVLNVMTYIDGELNRMTQLSLATKTEVLDQSDYVTSIIQHLSDALPYLAEMIPTHSYKSMLCEALLTTFMHSFITSIYKCRRINPTGAQQLLLDLTSLTNFLKSLLSLGDPEKEKFDQDEIVLFAKKVQKAATKPEAILKVLLSPENSFLQTYKDLIPNSSQQDLSIIMELKGISKNDRANMFQTLLKKK